MTRTLALATVASTAIFAASSAQAQEWEYSANVYLFMPETDIGLGDQNVTLSFSDALDNLDFAFMGAFQGTNGTWGFIFDYMGIDLGGSADGPGPISLDVNAKTETFTGFGTYRLYETATTQTELMAGLRYFRIKQSVSGGLIDVSFDEDWVDPVIGFRTFYKFNEDWSSTFVADVGGWEDRFTYQVLATANYQINDSWTVNFGLRYFDIKNDGEAVDFDYEQFGPIVGVNYKF